MDIDKGLSMSLVKHVVLSMALILGICASSHGQIAKPGGQVHVTVEPEGASVKCDGVVLTTPPVTVTNLSAGKHLIVVSKLGHGEIRRTVELEAGQRVNIEIKLKPILGLLLVHSEPPGASVEIEGAFRGETPLLVSNLPLGTYRMKFTSPGFSPKEVDLLLDKRTPRKIDINLAADSATIVLTSDPEGARAIVNGIDRGATPCTIDRIPEGESSIEIKLDGYEAYKRTVRLATGESQELEVVLVPIPASLLVVSIPKGARVYIDNQFKGEAPITIEDLAPGEYRVRAELPGHEVGARTITLARAQALTEEFRLAGNTGTIELTTEPAGISISVDGIAVGTTVAKPDQTDRVSEIYNVDLIALGHHEIQLSKKGYYAITLPITVEKGKKLTIHKQLRKRFIPNCEVVTKNAVHRGVLLEVTPAGDVKLELRPGVIRTVPAKDVRFRRPLREEE
ncbi:MAG: PEGA domain-containing protein [Kiritimatiellia bacterium]|jgi:hypothetical protein|nr:PEGA domain-containing protein [Kiritimatiellia bacterium]MDP6848827.1 PEGA domain-containing protein [Kiritimatiellia bacterium]